MSKKNSNIVAIVTMIFLFAMIAFVTNMAAPFGNIWKGSFAKGGMLGNMMNFLAYLFMGIPAGKILSKQGYKKTILLALAIGFLGILVQLLSSKIGGGNITVGNFVVYLTGAFICGFCVCLLNTVCNPALTLLGGGGARGNQFIQIAGTFNSLTGTLTPLFVGALIGTVTDKTAMSDVAPLLYIALGVFVAAFVVILLARIPEPEHKEEAETAVTGKVTPWNFRHFVLGVVAIFFYVGIEVGIPSQLIFYLSDATEKGAGVLVNGAAIGGALAAMYWLMMLVGRTVGATVGGKISPRTQLAVMASVAIALVVAAIAVPKTVTVGAPGYTVAEGFAMFQVPLSALLLILCGLCTSIMWGAIFTLSVEGLGSLTEVASGIFMMMVVGGGVMPFIQDLIAGGIGYMASYWLVAAMLVYLLFYALAGSKPKAVKE